MSIQALLRWTKLFQGTSLGACLEEDLRFIVRGICKSREGSGTQHSTIHTLHPYTQLSKPTGQIGLAKRANWPQTLQVAAWWAAKTFRPCLCFQLSETREGLTCAPWRSGAIGKVKWFLNGKVNNQLLVAG